MLDRFAVAALNHLLAGESWARERLRAFAGQHGRIAAGPLALDFAVESDGRLAARPTEGEPAVTVTLPPDAFLRAAGDRAALFAAARIAGSADFAETLAFVFRNLRWDVEEDLARVVGDIPARRLTRAGTAILAWQQEMAANLAANAAEYLGEESSVLASRQEVARFCSDVADLRAPTENLEKKVAALQQAQHQSPLHKG